MEWTIHIDGGPRRVNHAAVCVGERIFSFGGYCTGDNYKDQTPIDVFVLDTRTYRYIAVLIKCHTSYYIHVTWLVKNFLNYRYALDSFIFFVDGLKCLSLSHTMKNQNPLRKWMKFLIGHINVMGILYQLMEKTFICLGEEMTIIRVIIYTCLIHRRTNGAAHRSRVIFRQLEMVTHLVSLIIICTFLVDMKKLTLDSDSMFIGKIIP